MAEKTKSVQEGGIVFGDWKLFPVDSRNWELCHRHETGGTGVGAGVTKWHRLGRFYQCNTIDAAIQYAADCELKDGCHDRAMGLGEAIAEYRAIVDGMSAAVIAAARGQQ